MRRALRPVAIALVNEGLNGVDVNVWNDRPERVVGSLHVRLMRDGRDVVHEGTMPLALDGGESRLIAVETVLGKFVDASLAHGVADAAHDVVHAAWVHGGVSEAAPVRTEGSSLRGAAIIDEAVLSLTGDARPISDTGLTARTLDVHPDGAVVLAVGSASLAQLVRIGSAAHRASDSYFTLVAGVERLVRLDLLDANADRDIVVEALNDPRAVRLRHPSADAHDGR
jgi:beta-mannosidase